MKACKASRHHTFAMVNILLVVLQSGSPLVVKAELNTDDRLEEGGKSDFWSYETWQLHVGLHLARLSSFLHG